jgi:hypothetical protein
MVKELKRFHAIFVISMVIGVTFLPLTTASADIGPKPTMDFTFEFVDTPALDITSGELMQCQDQSCAQALALEEVGPQGFHCDAASCTSTAYGYSEWSYLRITFSNGRTLESNLFTKEHFSANYTVSVYADHLDVVETGGSITPMTWLIAGTIGGACLFGLLYLGFLLVYVVFIIKGGQETLTFNNARGWMIAAWVMGLALIGLGSYFSLTVALTVVVELVAAWVYLRLRHKPILPALTLVLMVNMPTLYGLLFVMNEYGVEAYWAGLLILEFFIWWLETVFLYIPLRKHFKFFEVLLFALLLNGLSYLVGVFLPF